MELGSGLGADSDHDNDVYIIHILTEHQCEHRLNQINLDFLGLGGKGNVLDRPDRSTSEIVPEK